MPFIQFYKSLPALPLETKLKVETAFESHRYSSYYPFSLVCQCYGHGHHDETDSDYRHGDTPRRGRRAIDTELKDDDDSAFRRRCQCHDGPAGRPPLALQPTVLDWPLESDSAAAAGPASASDYHHGTGSGRSH